MEIFDTVAIITKLNSYSPNADLTKKLMDIVNYKLCRNVLLSIKYPKLLITS
jgi:hypothetical protein